MLLQQGSQRLWQNAEKWVLQIEEKCLTTTMIFDSG